MSSLGKNIPSLPPTELHVSELHGCNIDLPFNSNI